MTTTRLTIHKVIDPIGCTMAMPLLISFVVDHESIDMQSCEKYDRHERHRRCRDVLFVDIVVDIVGVVMSSSLQSMQSVVHQACCCTNYPSRVQSNRGRRFMAMNLDIDRPIIDVFVVIGAVVITICS